MTAGVSPKLLEQLTPDLQARTASSRSRPAASAASARRDEATTVADLEPGSVLAVPLLTGDVDMTAVGTCTEVLGDRVFGFGHPFNNEGPVALPMGAGEINGVIANLMTSFKLGTMTGPRGHALRRPAGRRRREARRGAADGADRRCTSSTPTARRTSDVPASSPPRTRASRRCSRVMAIGGAVERRHELPQFHTSTTT